MAVMDTSGLGPNGEPVTTTSLEDPSYKKTSSRKLMDPEAIGAKKDWLDAINGQVEAAQSGPPTYAKEAGVSNDSQGDLPDDAASAAAPPRGGRPAADGQSDKPVSFDEQLDASLSQWTGKDAARQARKESKRDRELGGLMDDATSQSGQSDAPEQDGAQTAAPEQDGAQTAAPAEKSSAGSKSFDDSLDGALSQWGNKDAPTPDLSTPADAPPAQGQGAPASQGGPQSTEQVGPQGASTEPAQPRAPRTYEEAQDMANAYKAREIAVAKQRQMDEMAAIQRRRLQLQQESSDRISKAAENYSKRAEELYDNPGTLTRIMRALAVGLGAYGSGMTGAPNYAFEVIRNQQAHDLELKKMRMQAAEQQMQQAGASQGQLAQFGKEQEEHLLAVSKAQLESIDANANKMLAPFPQAQRQFKMEMAKMQVEQREKIAKFVQESTGRTEGVENEGAKRKVTQSEPQLNSKALAGMPDIEKFALAKELDKKGARLEQLVKKGAMPTPEQMDEFQNRENLLVERQHAESHGNVQVFLGSIGRALNALPVSAYPKNMTPEQREAMRLHSELGHFRAVTQYGQSAMGNPEQYQRLADPIIYHRGDTQAEGVEKARAGISLARETWQAAQNLSKAGTREQMLERKAAAPSAPITGRQLLSLTKSERRDYQDARRVKPGSADYTGAQSAIKALEAKARGNR